MQEAVAEQREAMYRERGERGERERLVHVTRRSGQRPRSMRPPISRPTHTDTLESTSAALPRRGS